MRTQVGERRRPDQVKDQVQVQGATAAVRQRRPSGGASNECPGFTRPSSLLTGQAIDRQDTRTQRKRVHG